MTDTDPKTREVTADSFAGFLAGFQSGAAHDEATMMLRDVVLAVQTLQKAGSVTVKLDVMPTGGRMMIVAPKVTATIPKPKNSSVFYADDAGGLWRNDPFQTRLDLDDRPAPEATTVTVEGAATATAVVEAPATTTVDVPPPPPITDPK